MERSRHFFVRRKRWNNIGSRPRSSSANLFAPRFRARNDRGTRVGVFVKAIFRLPCGVPVWKKTRKRSRIIYEFGTFSCALLSRFPRVGEHGNERKKAVRCDAGGHSAPACRHEFRRLHATHLRGGGQSADRSLIGDRSSRSNGASRLRETRSPAERIWFASWLVSASRASEKACTGV
jgi:hypothetical protein